MNETSDCSSTFWRSAIASFIHLKSSLNLNNCRVGSAKGKNIISSSAVTSYPSNSPKLGWHDLDEQGVGDRVWGVGTPPWKKEFLLRTTYFLRCSVSKYIFFFFPLKRGGLWPIFGAGFFPTPHTQHPTKKPRRGFGQPSKQLRLGKYLPRVKKSSESPR